MIENKCILHLAINEIAGTEHLKEAIKFLQNLSKVRAVSAIYKSKEDNQAPKIGGSIKITTPMSVNDLQAQLIEFCLLKNKLGLEMTILTWNQDVRMDPMMPLPNPRVQNEFLVLKTVLEVDDGAVSSIDGRHLSEMLQEFEKTKLDFYCQGQILLK